MNKGGNEVQVDLTQFPIGIAVFTLFENAEEVAERLVFVNPHKSLNITLEPDKPNYKADENTTITIRTTDENNNPISANCC